MAALVRITSISIETYNTQRLSEANYELRIVHYELTFSLLTFLSKKVTKTPDEKNSLCLATAFKQLFVSMEFVFYGFAGRVEVINNAQCIIK